MRPMPAETEHDRVPTWTRRGCASAAAAAATIAMPTIGAKKDLRDIFFPSLCRPETDHKNSFYTRPQTKTTEIKPGRANLRPSNQDALAERQRCPEHLAHEMWIKPHARIVYKDAAVDLTDIYLGDLAGEEITNSGFEV
jgi:hypothetical protein